MLQEGYLTQEELEEALSEQSLRLGEILIREGYITTSQLEHALNLQKKENKKLGRLLREMGYTTDEQIKRGLARRREKLGEVCLRKGFISNYGLQSALAMKRHGPRWMEKVWEGKVTLH